MEESWLDKVYALTAANMDDTAIDILFGVVDDHYLAGEFEAVNLILPEVDVERLNLNLLIGFLSITLTLDEHRELLPNRVEFFERVSQQIQVLEPEMEPKRFEGLLRGLR